MKAASFVFTLDDEALDAVAAYARDRGWEFSDLPYGYWKIAGPKLTLAAYVSGKFVVQGSGAQEFVEFTLEPQILHTFSASLAAAGSEGEKAYLKTFLEYYRTARTLGAKKPLPKK